MEPASTRELTRSECAAASRIAMPPPAAAPITCAVSIARVSRSWQKSPIAVAQGSTEHDRRAATSGVPVPKPRTRRVRQPLADRRLFGQAEHHRALSPVLAVALPLHQHDVEDDAFGIGLHPRERLEDRHYDRFRTLRRQQEAVLVVKRIALEVQLGDQPFALAPHLE